VNGHWHWPQATGEVQRMHGMRGSGRDSPCLSPGARGAARGGLANTTQPASPARSANLTGEVTSLAHAPAAGVSLKCRCAVTADWPGAGVPFVPCVFGQAMATGGTRRGVAAAGLGRCFEVAPAGAAGAQTAAGMAALGADTAGPKTCNTGQPVGWRRRRDTLISTQHAAWGIGFGRHRTAQHRSMCIAPWPRHQPTPGRASRLPHPLREAESRLELLPRGRWRG